MDYSTKVWYYIQFRNANPAFEFCNQELENAMLNGINWALRATYQRMVGCDLYLDMLSWVANTAKESELDFVWRGYFKCNSVNEIKKKADEELRKRLA